MSEERAKRPSRTRPAWRGGRPAATGVAAVVLTGLVLAVSQAFGVQAAQPSRGVPDPSIRTPLAAAQPLTVEPAAAFDVTMPESSPTPSPTSSDAATPAPAPTPSPTSDGAVPPDPAPTSAPEPIPAPSPTPADATTGPVPTPAPTLPAPSSGLTGGPAALALLGDPGTSPTYLPPGAPLTDLLPYQAFRVVVQLANGGADDVVITPRLEYRVAGQGTYRVVPDAATPGLPLHAAQEWTPAKVGTRLAPLAATTAADGARLPAPTGLAPARGHRSSGAGTAAGFTVAGHTVTEQEFTVALSVDAPYRSTYEVRVTDDGRALDGLTPVRVTVAATPPTLLSPGQRQGSDGEGVGDPASTSPAYRLVSQPSVIAASSTSSALLSPATTAAALFPLTTTPAAAGDPLDATTVGPNGPATIHDPYSSTTSGQCGVCHQTHTAQSGALVKATTTTQQCYTCHAGGVGGADVQAQYNLGQPANDPASRSYWSHDTADASGHTMDTDNEFAARLDRHSQCTDCHDPHGTTSDPATMTSAGWTLPGGLANVSGVAVSNGAAGTSPTYTWLDGTVAPVTAEYQLCFKCHSGFTTLPADVPGKPSQDVGDLAVELNPANASFHPVEAPGRNQTQKLADSLAGTSPYKLWNFSTGDTVRCVSCHSSNTTGTSTDPARNAPGATQTVHASTNRGILVRPYENRVLTAAGRFYDNQGFALCLTCHMETPFMNQYRPAAAEGTNFVFHGLHMAGITTKGSGGLDIDTPGAGQGNARCAECHFSSHGTTELPSTQTVSGDRLVVFGPDVLPSKAMGGVPTFTKTATGGSCTITCHGKDHQGATYSN
jgi:predicted CXXCH cytochrome family protein